MKEVRAKVGEDRDGKAFYKTIGKVLDTKNGPMLKLDMVPLQWDGWAYLSDPKPKDEKAPLTGSQQAKVYQTARDDDGMPPF